MAPELTRVGVYQRTVGASLERVWENVRDWEHLPWLHESSFSAIEAEDEGNWGWRARVAVRPAGEMLIELRIEPDGASYVVRTLEGSGKGSEIWTRLTPLGPQRTGVEVEFHLPGVEPEAAPALGALYVQLYTTLWDEDESMMRRRQAELSRRGAASPPAGERLDLGAPDELRRRLPLVVELGGRGFRVVELDGELVAHSTLCPHRLGPLEDAPIQDGCVRCPWHGYRFEVASGRSADGQRLRLAPAPQVVIDPEGPRAWLAWPGSSS